MITKEEFKQFLIENCVDDDGVIDISNIDFTDTKIIAIYMDNWKVNGDVSTEYLEAKEIFQSNQKADYIWNDSQEATWEINQNWQKADEIYQNNQRARIIEQREQTAKSIDQYLQKGADE